jgi:hypothetical protein
MKVLQILSLVYLLIPFATVSAQTLVQAKALWASLKFDAYEYTFTMTCAFCSTSAATPKRVMVQKNKVVKLTSMTGQEITPINYSEVFTIPELFSNFIQGGVGVSASYNPEMGYPERIVLFSDSPPSNQIVLKVENMTFFNLQSTTDLAKAQTNLDTAKALWNSLALQQYKFVLGRICAACTEGALQPREVVINNGVIQSVTATDGTVLSTAEAFTIQQLFDEVQMAIQDRVYKLDVTYDPSYGFPASIKILFDFKLPDEEVTYTVTEFEQIEVPVFEDLNLTAVDQTSVTNTQVINVPAANNTSVYQTELKNAKSLWESQALDHYAYKFQLLCNCLPEVTALMLVVVQNGQISKVVEVATGQTVSAEAMAAVMSIEDVFMDVETALSSSSTIVTASYNAQMGYPQMVTIGPADTMIADGDTTVMISDLVNLGDGFDASAYEDYVIAKAQWDSQGMLNYEFGYVITCNTCDSGTYQVTVQDGIAYRGINLSKKIFTLAVQTVNTLFDKLHDAIFMQAATISVLYNDEYGYPESFLIDYDGTGTNKLSVAVSIFIADLSQPAVKAEVRAVGLAATDLADARALWNSRAIDDYTYDYHKMCTSCPAPVRVLVRGGNVVGTSSLDSLWTSYYIVNATTVHTVAQLFQAIETAINAGAQTVDVVYNDLLGFPESVSITFGGMMGEDLMVEINGFYNLESSKTFQESIDQAKALWEYRGIMNYGYVFQRTCFCGADFVNPMNVTVANGVVSTVSMGGVAVSAAVRNTVKTVDELYAMILQSLGGMVTQMNVQFNTEIGYPKRIFMQKSTQTWDIETITITQLVGV